MDTIGITGSENREQYSYAMSARVCNPVALSEIAKLRSPAVVRKPMTNSISLARVKRDLFGPVDKQESKK